MLKSLFSPTERKEDTSRLRLGNPGFFLALSVGCLLIWGISPRNFRLAAKQSYWIYAPVALSAIVPAVGVLIHAFRWRSLSGKQKLGVVLLFLLFALVLIPVLDTLPIVQAEH